MNRKIIILYVLALAIGVLLSSVSMAIYAFKGAQTEEQLVASTLDEQIDADDTSRSMTYRIYDMFEEEWGEWWTNPEWGRVTTYDSSFIITSEESWNTLLYLPGYTVGIGPEAQYQGLIYAPYRWSMDGSNLPELTVADPEFMPVMGPSTVDGTTSVSMDLYFQYLYYDWWNDYWIPTWSDHDGWAGNDLIGMGNDGYYIGTVYDIVLNRPAAEMWLNMPQTADPITWWGVNGQGYRSAWQAWVDDQGNEVFDIWCGFEWPYVELTTMMDLTVDGEGNVILSIGHLNWGYEVLMTRWLDDSGLCEHQPWWEDFTMHVEYSEDVSDMTMDAVAQYSLHAVRATDTIEDAAWVWEPSRIDYVVKLGHPSDYEPYVDLKYESMNSGDNLIDQDVTYEVTPGWFNLSENEQLIIEFPKDICKGYKGVGTDRTDYENLIQGDNSAFADITVEDEASLGSYVSGGYDIGAGYDSTSKILNIVGPVDFDNERWPGGALYHGAPWIEMNVGGEAQPDPLPAVKVVMKSGSPQLSAETVDFTAPTTGALIAAIANDGLKRIAFEVYDVTSGVPELVAKEVCSLKASDAYPSGIIELSILDVIQGRSYEVVITPGGDDGTSADIAFSIQPPS